MTKKKKLRKKSINVRYGRNKKQLDSFEDDVVAHFSVNVGFQTNVRGVKYVPPPKVRLQVMRHNWEEAAKGMHV